MGAVCSLALSILSIPVTTSLILGSLWTWSFIYLNKWDPSYVQMNLSKLIQDNQWYRVLTSPFVHQNPAHVLINILALWGCCSRVEIVFGSLYFFKYTIMLMFIEAIGSLVIVQYMVRLYRHRKTLYRSTTRCWTRLQEAPTWGRRSLSLVIDTVTRRARGAFSTSHPEAGEDDEGTSLMRNGGEEEGDINEVPRDRGHSVDDESSEDAEESGDVYDPEYEVGSDRRSSFASVCDHPLTSEPVMGMSGVILAWLAFIAFQWFLRDTTIGTSDSTVVPPLMRHHHWGWVESPTVISTWVESPTVITTSTSTSTSTSNQTFIPLSQQEQLVYDHTRMYDRYSMATTPYIALGFVPVSVALCPPMFMITARLTLQPQIHTMSSHVRYMVTNLFMAPTGVLLALECLNALNDWYWLVCAVLNLALLLAASVVENRRIIASDFEVARRLFSKIDRIETAWIAERLAEKRASRRDRREGSGRGDAEGVGGGQEEGQEEQEEVEEEDDYSTDAVAGTGVSFGLITKELWDDPGRVVGVYDPLHFRHNAVPASDVPNTTALQGFENEEEVSLLHGRIIGEEEEEDDDEEDRRHRGGAVELSSFV